MDIDLTDIVDGMQHTLEDEGYSLYSKTPRERFTVLVMFHSGQKRFAFVVFDSADLGVVERTDVFIDMAEKKAAFAAMKGSSDNGGV